MRWRGDERMRMADWAAKWSASSHSGCVITLTLCLSDRLHSLPACLPACLCVCWCPPICFFQSLSLQLHILVPPSGASFIYPPCSSHCSIFLHKCWTRWKVNRCIVKPMVSKSFFVPSDGGAVNHCCVKYMQLSLFLWEQHLYFCRYRTLHTINLCITLSISEKLWYI